MICRLGCKIALIEKKQGLIIDMQLTPVEIFADPVQVQRIVSNILENSLKYKTKQQGSAAIRQDKIPNRAADWGWRSLPAQSKEWAAGFRRFAPIHRVWKFGSIFRRGKGYGENIDY